MAVEITLADEPLTLTTSARSLTAALTRIRRAIGRRCVSTPDAILLDGRANELVLSATSAQVSVATTLDAVIASPGTITVAGAQLADALKRFGGHVALRGDRLACGGIEHTLTRVDPPPGLSSPPPTTFALASVPAHDLQRLLVRAAYAMSDDATRPQLCGALLERVDDQLALVATDGHRLAVARVASRGPAFEMLIPRRGIAALGAMIENLRDDVIQIRRTDERVWFSWTDGVVSTPLVTESPFPAWRQVVPAEQPARITVSRREMLDAIRALTGRRDDGVQIKLDGAPERVTLRTATAVAEVTAVKEGSLPQAVAFNARYLRELLQALDDDRVTIEVSGELDPIRITAAFDTTAVVMPMRL